MSLKTLLETLKNSQMKLFNLKKIELNKKYKLLNENCIYSLLFIIDFLEKNGYILTHICLNDFEIFEQNLFLINDINIVELKDNTYYYTNKDKDQLQFIPKEITYKNNKTILYKSVGLFMYYLITQKIKNKLNEKDLNVIYYSKPYFFIKNTMDINPCLIYI